MRTSLRHYIVAVLVTSLALMLTFAWRSVFLTAPFMLLWGAVILSASYGGLLPGLLSTLISVAGALYFTSSFAPNGLTPATGVQTLIFTVLASVMSWERERFRQGTRLTMAARAHLTSLMNSATDFAIFSLDSEGKIATWSEGSERVFGYDEPEVLGRYFAFLYTDEDQAEKVPENEIRMASECGFATNERWHLRKDGTRFYANGALRPIIEDGEVCGFVKIARDVTHQRVMEQERVELLAREQQARSQAERANGLIMKFVGVISHEVRSPLAAIQGFATTLLQTDVTWSPKQQREYLGIIVSETDRLSELTEHLLDFTQLETGNLRMRQQVVTLDALISRIQPELTTISQRHELKVETPQPSPTLLVDPIRISQVFVNVIGNATRYCPENTEIRVSGSITDHTLQIDVTDQGPGIPPDRRVVIFDAFTQAEIDQQAESKGAGLGLAIAKGIVEAHGGRIWIDPQYAPGTRVSFTLPLANGHSA